VCQQREVSPKWVRKSSRLLLFYNPSVQIVSKLLSSRGLLAGLMPIPDARTRVRQRIKRLLEDRGVTQGAFAHALGHRDQWASHFFQGKFPLSLDQLDDAAKFFNVPPGEIVRVQDEPWELSPTEMRVVRALRMLPPPVRDHLTILADYLIGVTPDEVEVLTKMRQLSASELRRVEHWIDVTLLSSEPAQEPEVPNDRPETAQKRVVTTPRTRKSRGA
jgi:transcriptional regulator with XRE-family HTH domain